MEFNTKLLHGRAVTPYPNGATLPPIAQSNAFQYESFEQLEQVFAHKAMGFAYSRIGNPTVAAFEQRVAELEGGAGAVATSSGMAALSMALLCILSPGDEIIAGSGSYGGTIDLFGNLEKLGITTRFVHELTAAEIAPLITPRTRVIFGELISNPSLRVMDVAAVAELAHAHGLPLLVDSTTATPYLATSLALGADIVVHSSSKYISGSGDAISGIIVDGGKFPWNFSVHTALQGFEKYRKMAFLTRLRTDLWENFGGCLAPMNAFLGVVGLETLGLRMDRICENAAALAAALDRAGVSEVCHPSLPQHPAHDLCIRQFRGRGGGILTFRAGSRDRAAAILNRLEYAAIASNVGDVRTLVIHPASTIAMKNTEAQRQAAGIYDDTIRVSVGIEDPADLIKDFLQAVGGAD
ncbi:MAG: aminotransferase class I/II-fold pyridoxal phosphate-dependent enzyme [Bacillota bacterium]|nr:aminotransferase class I/II-fold pyridoxal phosphate-dependent enzyme [Bacillota bacterium]